MPSPDRDQPNDTLARPPKAAVVVANELRRRIVTSEIRVGDSLPPESKLVEELQASRPTLRAALRILESEQLITVRRGSRGGAWVNPPTFAALSFRAGVYMQYHGITLDEVYLARAAVEPAAARMVAEAADPAAIARLEAMVNEERRSTADRAVFRRVANEFHQVIVDLAGNETLKVLAAVLYGVIGEDIARRPLITSRYRHGAARHQEHVDFIEYVRRGDGPGAEQMWADHLEAARQVFLGEGSAERTVDLLG